ncbi:MAG: amidohydrolase family protein [Woeseiaceae bacterium]|nr:amidohydrolase family protein [Woeseiaceae bacterium]
MNSTVISALAGFTVLIGVMACEPGGEAFAEGRYALVNVHLFDGSRASIREHVNVLVADGRIERIDESNAAVPAGYERIDGAENYLMPGLFDVHTHLDNLAAAERALASGVTTVRSASVSAFQDVAFRELVKSGAVAGPDMLAAGIYITPDLGDTILADPRLASLSGGVTTDAELRQLVNINASRGVDVIKTRGTQRAGLPDTDPRRQVYTEHQLRVVVEEAAKHGIAVLVHAHGDEGARAAVLAGARSIEHGTYLSEETLQFMKERGTWFVPTWVTMNEMNEERYDYVLRLRGHHMVPHLEEAIRMAHRLGVRMATGADNYYQADSINRISFEVERFAELGLSNFEALQTATTGAAELLGIADRTGRIAPGYEADMILVPGNPLEDVSVLHDVLLVMSNGRLVVRRIPFGLAAE